MFTFASLLDEVGRSFCSGLRGAYVLGNANNGGNAGSMYLNGNNGVSNANANYGAFLNNVTEGEPGPLAEHDIDSKELRSLRLTSEQHTCWRTLQL